MFDQAIGVATNNEGFITLRSPTALHVNDIPPRTRAFSSGVIKATDNDVVIIVCCDVEWPNINNAGALDIIWNS